MERLQLDPSALSDPEGAGADELIRLLNRLSAQFQDFIQAETYASHLDMVILDLRECEPARFFANQMRKGDTVLCMLSARDADGHKSKFFFNRDGSMRLVIKESQPGFPRGRGGRMTWARGIQEIYDVFRSSCLSQARLLIKAARKLKP